MEWELRNMSGGGSIVEVGGQAVAETAVATQSGYPDIPPVHVATDQEVGRAVPEVDACEVAQRVTQLRDVALRFQAVDQDLGRRETWGVCYTRQTYTQQLRFSTVQDGFITSAPVKGVLPLKILTSSR